MQQEEKTMKKQYLPLPPQFCRPKVAHAEESKAAGCYGNYTWVYVAAVCAVGAIVYARMPETKGIDL
jgi:hypothetical protein